MLKITDCRENEKCKLKDIEDCGFFEYDKVLCRKVTFSDSDLSIIKDYDSILFIEMPSGQLGVLNRNTTVNYIPSENLELYIGG